jgi:DNA repair protein RecO (recombination protein O)
MDTHQTEGIVLKSVPFQDYDRILTVFSPHAGIIKFIIKGANKPTSSAYPVNLLTRAEFVYSKSNSDLCKCSEVSVMNHHLSIRNSYERLEAACDMSKSILSTQFQNAPAEALYELYLRYLENIATIADPQLLSASFRLKVLRHEGLFEIGETCHVCQTPLETFHMAGEGTFCKQHAPPQQIVFNANEILIVAQLAYCKNFSQLAKIELSSSLKHKIEDLFQIANS